MVKSVNTNKVEMDKKAAISVVFENPEFGKIRTLTEENGNPLFCAKNLCKVLEYKRVNGTVNQLVKPLDTAKRRTWVESGQKKLIGEQNTEIRRLNDVADEQVVRIAKNGENIIQLENQVGND